MSLPAVTKGPNNRSRIRRSVRPAPRRGSAVEGQAACGRSALDEFSLVTHDPHVARRRLHTGEQNVTQEIPLRGIRTARNAPGGAIPMQQQRFLARVAVGGEIDRKSVV